jgi:hypothetical protein
MSLKVKNKKYEQKVHSSIIKKVPGCVVSSDFVRSVAFSANQIGVQK